MIHAERIAKIQWLVLDVDGVLTDGRIVYSSAGDELKSFHVRDGSGLILWNRAGHRAAVITGRTSPVVDRRAAELRLAPVVQGAANKGKAYADLLEKIEAMPEQVCAIGDDIPDLPVLKNCGFAVAVADACSEVRETADYVTRTAGGAGAVREVVELLLRTQARWDSLIQAV